MTNDVANSYSYNTEGLQTGLNSYSALYDAFNRPIDIQGPPMNAWTQIVYARDGYSRGPRQAPHLRLLGWKFAKMHGQTVNKYFAPLVAGVQAVYTAAKPAAPAYWRHVDWLGSARLATTPSQTVAYDGAYAPFGENYAETGTTDRSFTGQTQDSASGLYDFLFRKQSSAQGRWLVPDPAGLAAVDITNPQTWNRYAYVGNNPLNAIDPLGLYCMWEDGTQDDNPEDGGETYSGCMQGGGSWMDVTSVTVNGDTGEASFWQSGADQWDGDPLGAFWEAYRDKIRAGKADLAAPPTNDQYIQAIHNSFASFPNVCGVGAAGYLGGGKLGAGVSADTQNGVHFASGFNFINAGGFKINYTVAGGANGNISYFVPVPGTGAGVEVGTQNGSLQSIQSVALSTNSPGWKNATVYANVSNMGDSNCK